MGSLPANSQLADTMNTQVMRLLSGVSMHGDQHLAEVERDLVQMDVLLGEAIKKLCASFMAIHQAVDRQQEALKSVLSAGEPAPEQTARLDALREEIEAHIGAAITGLQFQDMTSQLIGRMVKHLSGLRDVFGELGVDGAGGMPESSSEELMARLNDITDRVGERCSALSGPVRSSVSQRHMESGDIELF